MNNGGGRRDEQKEKGLLWKLPSPNSNQLGKLGPAFGVGVGCDVGFAVGLIGAGCEIGVGFGYGVGKGIAYDGNRRYSNVGRASQYRGIVPVHDEIGALVDELVLNIKKLIKATSSEVDKWRRL